MKKKIYALLAALLCIPACVSVSHGQQKLWGINGSVVHMNLDGSDVVQSFGEVDGIMEHKSIALGLDGAIYGSAGGTADYPIYGENRIFKIDADGLRVIHQFHEYAEGHLASLVDGGDGFIYGVSITPVRGRFGYQVFKMRYDGSDFVDKKDVGGYAFLPDGLIRTSSGDVLGLSQGGGAFGKGFIYRIRPDLTGIDIIYSFAGENGIAPYGKLVEGSDGKLYGTTMRGGKFSFGVVYKVSITGEYTKLFDFDGNNGRWPQGGLVQDGDGYLYGTTSKREKFKNGLIFRIKPDGSDYTRLYVFDEVTGWNPSGDIFLGEDGYLYGQHFRVRKDGTGFEKQDLGQIYFLRSGQFEPNVYLTYPADGSSDVPLASTFHLNALNGSLNYTLELSEQPDFSGEIISITSPSDSLEVSGLENSTTYYARIKSSLFPEYGPVTSFTTGLGVRLWGITTKGGTSPCANGSGGTIFSIRPDGTSFIKHFDYDCAIDTTDYRSGKRLDRSLVLGDDQMFYGVSITNPIQIYNTGYLDLVGFYGSGEEGEIFRLDRNGNNFTTLYENLDIHHFSYPVIASNGEIYVTNPTADGNKRLETIRKFKADGSTDPAQSVIHRFNAGRGSGSIPRGTPIELPDGYLYGVTQIGGTFSRGIIYKIRLDGSDFTKVYDFESGLPRGGLFDGKDGFLYGMDYRTYGSIYKVRTDGSDFTTLHQFGPPNSSNGKHPYGTLIEVDNVLYGMTPEGGKFKVGIIFSIQKDGTDFTILHHFSDSDGALPLGDLTFDGNGTLYGMTSAGGNNNLGTIFSLPLDGSTFNKLFDFSMETGGGPDGKLLLVDPSAPVNQPTVANARKSETEIAHDVERSRPFQVYPNPFSRSFVIEVSNDVAPLIVTIRDVRGRAVYQGQLSSSQLNELGDDLASGLYMIHIVQGNKTGVYRMMKR